MSIPMFTAESSIYGTFSTRGAVHLSGSAETKVTPVLMSLGVSCSGGGMDCYCDGGCIRKKGSWCCCSGDKNCPPKGGFAGVYETGAGFFD
jgi:hypothetical protein